MELPESWPVSSLQSSSFVSACHFTLHQAFLSSPIRSMMQPARMSTKLEMRGRLHPTESFASLLITNQPKKFARLDHSSTHVLKSADLEHTSPLKWQYGFELLPDSYLLSTFLSVKEK